MTENATHKSEEATLAHLNELAGYESCGNYAAPPPPTGVQRVDSWKVTCQECREDFTDSNDWSIWADRWYAIESAQEHDWVVRDGLVLCVSCWEEKPFCRDEDNKCVRRDVAEADDGWLYCPDHIGQGLDCGDYPAPCNHDPAHPRLRPGKETTDD